MSGSLSTPAKRGQSVDSEAAHGSKRRRVSLERKFLEPPKTLVTPSARLKSDLQQGFLQPPTTFVTPSPTPKPVAQEMSTEKTRDATRTAREKEIISVRTSFPQDVTEEDILTYSHHLGRPQKTVKRWFNELGQGKTKTSNLSFEEFFSEKYKTKKNYLVGCGVLCKDDCGDYDKKCPSCKRIWHDKCLKSACTARKMPYPEQTKKWKCPQCQPY